MIDLVKIIESDDLEKFKMHFDLSKWKDSITTIENYAGISRHTPTISYNDADCIKYALHCNADKIFNYLLPLVDTDKHGDNYGWPLLAMAVKNNRYDYANKIINHHNFNPYPMYHTNSFSHIESRTNIKEHIDFLFNYLEKFTKWDFSHSNYIYNFTYLICYNEETFSRFDRFYKNKFNDNNLSVLEMFKDHMDILGDEVFYRTYKKFVIEKLDDISMKKIIEKACKNNIFFMRLFESENAKDGLQYLIKYPDELKIYFEDNEIMISYLPLEGILLLTEHGIDIWTENKDKRNALDYILKNDNLEDEATSYFINKYPQEIYDRLKDEDRKSNIQKYCHQKILQTELKEKINKNHTSKI